MTLFLISGLYIFIAYILFFVSKGAQYVYKNTLSNYVIIPACLLWPISLVYLLVMSFLVFSLVVLIECLDGVYGDDTNE